MFKNKLARRRLSLDLETVRTLQSEELVDVAGGQQQAAIGLSITISIGGDCNCCRKNAV